MKKYDIANCPVHGLHAARISCWVCDRDCQQVTMVPVEELSNLVDDAIEYAAMTALNDAGGTWDDGSSMCQSDSHKRYQEQWRLKAKTFIVPYLEFITDSDKL